MTGVTLSSVVVTVQTFPNNVCIGFLRGFMFCSWQCMFRKLQNGSLSVRYRDERNLHL